MRLIDVDKLETHEQMESMGNGMYDYVEVVYKDDIDAMPTVEAIPVEWIENIIAMAKKAYAYKFAESLELMIEDWREEQRKEI